MYAPLLLKNWSILLDKIGSHSGEVLLHSTMKPSRLYLEGFDLIFIYEGLTSSIFNTPPHFLWHMESSVKHKLLWFLDSEDYTRISELFTLSRRDIVLISLILFILFVTLFIMFCRYFFPGFLLPYFTLSLKCWIFYILSFSSLFIRFH